MTDGVPTVPGVAASVFGDALPAAERYVARLATDGVTRGLIGPREVARLWERHVLNSAAVSEAVPPGSRVVDVGSGAGLPGIPLALARPDLRLTLVEPMARRVSESRQPERLSPMNPFERKVVHDVIAAVDGVRSESEGEEPQRRVVVLPEK